MDEGRFFDRLRGIAQLGLAYTDDPYDRERYTELLVLASQGYTRLTGVPAAEVEARFRRELGYVTPKVGVDAAIFSDRGLLVIRRADSKRWALPGGWAELGQSAEESVAREVLEEVALTVTVGKVIAVSTQLPGPYAGPHTSIHVLYHCTAVTGHPQVTPEATDVVFVQPEDVSDWHGDHGRWAAKAASWARARGAMP